MTDNNTSLLLPHEDSTLPLQPKTVTEEDIDKEIERRCDECTAVPCNIITNTLCCLIPNTAGCLYLGTPCCDCETPACDKLGPTPAEAALMLAIILSPLLIIFALLVSVLFGVQDLNTITVICISICVILLAAYFSLICTAYDSGTDDTKIMLHKIVDVVTSIPDYTIVPLFKAVKFLVYDIPVRYIVAPIVEYRRECVRRDLESDI